jgi:hypothetical protein
MATKIKLELREGNDETVTLRTEMNGGPRNITGRLLEVYIKVDANQDDEDADLLTSDNGDITITDGTGGIAEMTIPGSILTTDKQFWRYDVVDGNTRNTHIYGPLEVVNI